MSLIIHRNAFNAAAATETKTFKAVDAGLTTILSAIVTVEPSAFSGTIDFKGRSSEVNGTYTNLAYGELDLDGGISTISNNQISLTADSTRRRYLIPYVEPDTEIVMTRTAGSVSVWVTGSAMPIPVDRRQPVSLISLENDQLLRFGDSNDIVALLRSSVLNANTALDDVLVGTPVALALAANSFMVSNTTASGDIAFYTNKAGDSNMGIWLDGSSGDVALLTITGQSIDHYINGSKVLDHAAGAFAFQESTTISSTGTLSLGDVSLAGTVTGAAQVLSNLGKTYIGDTADAKVTLGLVINQGANDDDILSLKSSDVAHGMTDWAETDTWAKTVKYHATNGGSLIMGLSAANVALALYPHGTTDVTTKLTNSEGYLYINVGKANGTAAQAAGADANLLVVANRNTNKLIVDAEGTIHNIVGSDADNNLLTAQVTGTPTILWNESADAFGATKPWSTSANVGAVNTGVTAEEYGDGRAHVSVLTVSQVDALTFADNAAIADGYLLYTLPAGAVVVDYAYMSMAITAAAAEQQTDTPDVGLGTVIGSGVVATLDGTPTFENIITGQTANDCNGTAEVKTALPTAGVPFVIEAGAAHTIYFNAADTWADIAGADLTADITGTVVLVWRFLA